MDRQTKSALVVGGTTRTAVAGGVLLTVLGLTTQDIWPIALACAIGAALITCGLGCWYAATPEIEVDVSDTMSVGRSSATTLTFSNPGRTRTRPVAVTHGLCRPLMGKVHFYVEPLAVGEQLRATAERVPIQRGNVPHSHLEIETLGAFGMFRRRTRITVRGMITVFPERVRARQVPTVAAGAPGAHGMRTGDELRGVREWRSGDNPRDVNWRATARTGALAVVERGEPRGGTLVILPTGTWGDPEFEHALAEAAATGLAALDGGDTVYLAEPHHETGKFCASRLGTRNLLSFIATLPSIPDFTDDFLDEFIEALEPGDIVLQVAPPGIEPWRVTLANGARVRNAVLFVAGSGR